MHRSPLQCYRNLCFTIPRGGNDWHDVHNDSSNLIHITMVGIHHYPREMVSTFSTACDVLLSMQFMDSFVVSSLKPNLRSFDYKKFVQQSERGGRQLTQ